nr:unnamed protein product [Callosobruchus analis]
MSSESESEDPFAGYDSDKDKEYFPSESDRLVLQVEAECEFDKKVQKRRSRKRERSPSAWAVNVRKEKRNRGYYKLTKEEKKLFLLANTTKQVPERRRKGKCEDNSKKKGSFHFYFTIDSKRIQVCKSYFLGTLSISTATFSKSREAEELATSRMPRLCCVPRCKSNYKSTLKMEALQTTFSFPKKANLGMRWLKAIHRDNYTVTKNSVVCCKHFDEDEITRHEVFKDKDGTSQEYPLARPKLKEGSVPHIFENLPKYMSVSIPKVRRDPQQRKEDCLQRKAKQIENFLNSDLIADFDTFKEHVQHKIVFKNWSFKVASEYLQRGGLSIATDEIGYIYHHVYAIFTYITNNESIQNMLFNQSNHQNIWQL